MIRCVSVVITILTIAPESFAQAYPDKPVRLIVPFAPGGTSDIIGRLLSIPLSRELGQTVVVDNRAGAGSTVGTAIAAKSPADGYTLVLNHLSLAINQSLYPRLAYDAQRDLAPVTCVGDTPNVIVVNPSVPARNLKEFIALAKSEPGRLNYSSGGVGSGSHLPAVLFEDMANVKFSHIPYKGGGPAVTAVIAGEVQFSVSSLPTAAPYVNQGRLRILAVTGGRRSSEMPEVPTVAEAGLAGFEFSLWYGVFVPAGTAQSIIAKLNQVLVKLIDQQELKKQFAQQGVEAFTSSPKELGERLRVDIVKWEKIVKIAGLKPE